MAQFTDDEIREMIRGFRNDHHPLEYCNRCPFVKRSRFYLKNYYCFSCCSRIFGYFSIRRDHYNKACGPPRMSCPCFLYGPEYTAEKIAEFMGEI